jgi:hypothetical protein
MSQEIVKKGRVSPAGVTTTHPRRAGSSHLGGGEEMNLFSRSSIWTIVTIDNVVVAILDWM